MQIQEFTAVRDWRSIHSSRYGPLVLDALLTFLQSRCWISKTKDGPISNMLVYRSFQIQKRKEIVKAVHLSSNTQEDIHLSQYLLDLPIVETHNPNVESALEQHFCYVIFSQKTGGVSFWHFEKEPYFKAAWGYFDSYLLRECDIPCFFLCSWEWCRLFVQLRSGFSYYERLMQTEFADDENMMGGA